MTEERKHEIEDIIDNALTEEDCRAWAEGNLTDHVKQLIKEYHIKQLNIWDDVCEIVEVEERKKLTQEEKQIIAEGHGLNINKIPDSLETTTKKEWASDIAAFWEIDHEGALDQLNDGEGYSSVSLPTGGMVAVETNGDHLFFVSDMES